jgi:hypothetical protein
MIYPSLTFLIWKQSINFYKFSVDNLLKFLEFFRALLAWFLKMIRGRLLPSTFSISSTPKAKTSASSTTVIVSLLALPFLRLAYS